MVNCGRIIHTWMGAQFRGRLAITTPGYFLPKTQAPAIHMQRSQKSAFPLEGEKRLQLAVAARDAGLLLAGPLENSGERLARGGFGQRLRQAVMAFLRPKRLGCIIRLTMSGPFQFDAEKATEAVIYIASRTGGDMYVTLKLLYLADKCHLHRFGRFIFGDQYYALPHGPVPDGAYGIVKRARQPQGAANFKLAGNQITPSRDADLDAFSASDLECLDEAIRDFGRLSFGELKQLTHDAAYNATTPNGAIAISAIAALAEDPVALLQHLADSHPG